MSDYEEEIEAEELDAGSKSEAQAAMEAAKKRQDEEEAERLREYEEQRRMEREKEEEELRMLKEKQERRKKEREEEEQQILERQREAEERRKQEEEERKAKQEAEKRKKEEEKKKRAEMMKGLNVGAITVPAKGEGGGAEAASKGDKFGNIVQAKAEMGMTKEQMEEKKKDFIAKISEPMDLSGLDVAALRQKCKEIHQRICRLEADRYDLEKRHERQEYDLKELNERQRQINRNKALKKGLDPDAANSRFPPKVAIASKYDRQTDRRSFSERKHIFDKPNTKPHFPNCPPQPEELIFAVQEMEKPDEDDE